jgi:hypothetical protein
MDNRARPPRRRAGGIEAGRSGGEILPERKESGGRARVADGEAEVAQSRRLGVQAHHLGRGRGAVKRQARAQRAGGGRVAAQMRVKEREAGASGEQGVLPCSSARPCPGWNRRRRRKGWRFGGGRRAPACPRAPPRRRRNGLAELGERIENEGRIAANHFAMMSPARRFVSSFVGLCARLVVGEACPIRLRYQTHGRYGTLRINVPQLCPWPHGTTLMKARGRRRPHPILLEDDAVVDADEGLGIDIAAARRGH